MREALSRTRGKNKSGYLPMWVVNATDAELYREMAYRNFIASEQMMSMPVKLSNKLSLRQCIANHLKSAHLYLGMAAEHETNHRRLN